MKLFVLLILLLFTQLSAFQSFEITDEQAKIDVVKKPSYYVGELTQKEAYDKFKSGKFEPFTKSPKSFGFSDESIWIALEIVNRSKESLFFHILNESLEKVTLFAYYSGTLIKTSQNEATTSKEKRYNKHYALDFTLEKIDKPVTYLFKISSLCPIITALLIGDEGSIVFAKLPEIIVFSIFIGLFFSFLFYNIFLYFSTKEADYFLYTAYILFLFIFVSLIRESFTQFFSFDLSTIYSLKIVSLSIILPTLLLLTLKYFDVKEFNFQLYKITKNIAFVFFIFAFITPHIGVFGQIVSFLMIVTANVLSFYIGAVKYLNGYNPAKYYLFGLGGFLAGVFVSAGVINGLFDYNIYTSSALLAGTAWEIVFFSLALGYKIKLIHLERNEALSKVQMQEKMMFLQSRQASVGELVGNIAHQWREPLAEIGSIQTNLKATLIFKGDIAKDKLLNSVEQSYNIIRHLSDTIDVFYRFFRHKSSDKEEFDVIEEIQNIQKMVHYSLNVENISLQCECEQKLFVYGERSEFANAVLNIILNAKDVLVERKIVNPLIKIKTYKNENGTFITIQDNAGGIKQEPIDKIFEMAISSKDESIGIGLFISKAIIEQRMHGKLSVENSGLGALFTIMLPESSKVYSVENELALYDIKESAFEKICRLEKKVAKSVELEKALAQWEDIFNQTHWGVAVHRGTSNSFEMINPAFCKMYGYSEKELKNISEEELFSKESLPVLHQKQKEAFVKGFVSFEAEHIRKDGSTFPVNIDMTVVKDENGDILYHIVNVRDITEQKKANRRLYLKKFAVDNINDAIFLADKKGDFHYVNEAACSSLGYTREELLTMGVGDVDPDWPKERWPEFWESLKKDKTALIEVVHKRYDGTLFPVEIKANYFEYEGVEYNLGLARDITERILAQKELLILEQALNNTHEAIYIVLGDRITQVNDGACKMLGYTREELTSMTLYDIDKDLTPESLKDLRENNIHRFERKHYTKDGQVLAVEIDTSAFEYDGITYAFSSVRDITEQKKAREELLLKEFALDKINEAVYLIDKDLMFHYANDGACKALGYTKEELLTKGVTDLDPNFPVEAWRMHWKDIKKLGTTLTVTQHRRKDGTVFPIEVSSNYFEYNGVGYSLAVSRDITERLLLEAEKENRIIKMVAENSPDVIIRYDVEGRRTYVNPKGRELLGVEIGKSPLETTPIIDKELYVSELKKVIKTGLEATFEITYINVVGGIDYSHIRMVPEFNDSGNISSVLMFGRDITELTNKTIELQKALEFNEGVIAAIPDLLFEIAPDGTYIGIWAQNEELLVAQKELLLYKNFKEILPPDAVITSLQTFKEVDEKGLSLGKIYSLDFPDGKKWFELSVSKKKSSGNYIALSRDITERKELEILLEKERKFLIDAQRVAHTGSWHLDIPNDVLSWSDETYKIFELEKENIENLHKTFYERIHPDDRESVNAPYLESLKTGVPYQVEHRIVMNDGRIKHVIERCEHVYDRDAKPLYSIGTVQDITERKLIEKELADSYNFLHKLIDSVPDPVFVKDRQHTWIMLNKAFCDLIGEPKDALIGKSDYDFFPKEEADVFWEKDEIVFKSGEVNINEEKFTDSDGTTHHIQTVKIMFISENGDEYLVGTIRDITKRKEMEDSIRALNETLERRVEERTVELQELVATLHEEINEREKIEKQLKLVSSAVNSSNEAIYVNNKELSIIYVNEGACKMLGYTYDELTSMKIYEIDALYHVDDILALRDETIKSKQAVFETKHKTKDGNIIDVEIVGNPFVYDNMEVFVSVVKDISAKK